jgi:hypothetical protein
MSLLMNVYMLVMQLFPHLQVNFSACVLHNMSQDINRKFIQHSINNPQQLHSSLLLHSLHGPFTLPTTVLHHHFTMSHLDHVHRIQTLTMPEILNAVPQCTFTVPQRRSCATMEDAICSLPLEKYELLLAAVAAKNLELHIVASSYYFCLS